VVRPDDLVVEDRTCALRLQFHPSRNGPSTPVLTKLTAEMEAAAGAWLSSDKRNCGPGPHRRHSRDRRSELFAFSHSGGPLIHMYGELVRVLPKRESMNSPLHWQGGPPRGADRPHHRGSGDEELDG
jgi:hypothetical protein